MTLPAPIIELHNEIYVVRDDLLEGGSKRRFVRPLLETSDKEWVYVSPTFGYGQVSFAYVCRDLGLKCTVFVPARKQLHPLTLEAQSVGANIIQVPMGFLSNCTAKAKEYCIEHGANLAPFGFDHPIVVDEIAKTAQSLPIHPVQVWSIVSSGTLSRGLQKAWPTATFYGVYVGHAPTEEQAGRCEYIHAAPEKFEQKAKTLPPFPSAVNYDAKAWQFVKKYADDRALFWNVGK